jgi:hypothetical protein
MPFDGTTFPSLQSLSDTLRDRSCWPAGFEWDYGDCRSYAMGMAWKLWEATMFLGFWLNKENSEITPEHVADALDEHLARRVVAVRQREAGGKQ